MRHLIAAVLLTVLAQSAVSEVTVSQYNDVIPVKRNYTPWKGIWYLNKTETHYPPDVNIIANEITVTKDDGKTLQYTEIVTTDAGITTQTFDGIYDGPPVDVGNGETLEFKHLTTSGYLAIRYDKNGTLVERTFFNVTRGGKRLICQIFVTAHPSITRYRRSGLAG